MRKFYLCFTVLIGTIFTLNAQQNVFSRSDAGTGNFGDAFLPWYYQASNNNLGDPDNGNTVRNFVKIGHNNNTTMTTNGRYYIVNTLDFEAAATSARTINNSGGGLSASGGIYNASSATHVFDTPIGIDGSTVQIHSNSTGGMTFNNDIFINANTVQFGNTGTGVITVNGTMQGTGNVEKIGTNNLIVTGSHTYSGSTTINAGRLILQGDVANSVFTVRNGATLEIDNSVTVSGITVEGGGALIVNSGNTLTTTTGIILTSESTRYPSLILDGTISSSLRYDRHVNDNDAVNGNDLISAPLTGQAFNVFIDNNTNILANPSGTDVLFGPFDNDDAINPFVLWDEENTTTLTAGIGYRTGLDPTSISDLVSFEGTANSSDVLVAIDQGTASILNLVGNPFPSYLDAQAFLTENAGVLESTAQVIYGYNDSTDGTSSDDYTIISTLENNTLNIAPGQAFFVASNSAGGDIEFTTSSPDMRITSDQDDFIAGRNAASTITNVNISLTNASDDFITKVFFTPSSGLGLDPGYDASLIGGVAPEFALFSHLVQDNMNVPFATQALGENDYNNTTVALGVNANLGEQLTFSIADNTLPASIEIYLDDTENSTSTLLNSGDYVLTPVTSLSGTGRFYLRFSNNALTTTEQRLDHVTVYTNQSTRTINISGQLDEGTIAMVYDVQGRKIITQKLSSESILQRINSDDLSTGVYIVKLYTKTKSKSVKLVIR
ncbi:T9SS type A sorting domain-containing protein [Winogradskyella sp. KYW1333]|uniref:T9SS type A sorting domain-containing protein n=1 Tax=Winogradskyella sp. KYW1333 TaxID=2282123 RepID=UPI000DF43A87|nr:T9SS type A sorting domain-containing protein [Winogradskyella sp. KYW1333]RCT54051.1 T9SS C-terminal target domain-containing protein [Winogradskyella sp. KYW1333]